MRSSLTVCFTALALVLLTLSTPAAEPQAGWMSDYAEAMSRAEKQGKMLLVVFTGQDAACPARAMQDRLQADPALGKRLAEDYVCLSLPADAQIHVGGQPVKVLDHPAFTELDKSPGMAVLDFTAPKAAHYGLVVSTISGVDAKDFSTEKLAILLDLPPGSPDARAELLATRLEQAKVGPPLQWLSDYAQATSQAKREGRMLLILFAAEGDAARCDSLEEDVLADTAVRKKLAQFTRLRVPLDATIRMDGKEVRLIDQSGFEEMLGRQGIAIIDYTDPKADFFGTVVSTFPILYGRPYSTDKVLTMLDLPSGTLTQRTLIFAVRIHPERPASTNGQLLNDLAREAASHSDLQARIGRQGHHQWNTRFQRIRSLLPGYSTPSEVCAESWPGEGLLVAAIDCVRCWRLSSGHWSKVRSRHLYFGYDMRRGRNGIWYATGIFGE
ncbi:MAG: hypothetical protein JW818_20710 [Pirellulales bacterium]|nr:hypothetical protein [Pirellulales bacterium]